MKKIKIERTNGVEEMNIDTYVRWLSLMESIYIVTNHADKIGVHVDKDLNWVKPISFQKYMDDRFTSMKHEVEMDLGIFKGGLENPENKPEGTMEEEVVEEEVEINEEELASVVPVDIGVVGAVENAL